MGIARTRYNKFTSRSLKTIVKNKKIEDKKCKLHLRLQELIKD